MTVQTQDRLVRRLVDKLQPLAGEMAMYEAQDLEDADVAVVCYGITSRVAQRAIDVARGRGLRVGKFRLITAWPFPEKELRALAARIKGFVVPELNLGQMVREVERVAGGTRTLSVTHAGGGVHRPEQILEAIMEASQ
jgi:2-oxoglutarate ferredoxin oxidoreductase subunit alpha